MKKALLIMMAMAVLLTGVSLAETATPTSTPAAVEEQSGEQSGGGLFDWISNGWNTMVTTVESGWNAVTDTAVSGWNAVEDTFVSGWNAVEDAAVSGWNTVAGTVESGVSEAVQSILESEWYRTVEEFVVRNSTTVSDAVVQSWDTIKQGAVDIGTVTWEKMEEAYHTIIDWFTQNKPEEKEEVTEALDQIMLELRAEYPENAN